MAETKEEVQDRVDAVKFLGSSRGRFIVSQALYHGIKALEAVEGVHKEESNIEDRKYIRDKVFDVELYDFIFSGELDHQAKDYFKQKAQ